MPNYTSYIMLQNITHILDELQKLAVSSYKSCDTHVLSIRAAPHLVDSLLFLKLVFLC
ncbi:unknown [Rickettsia conorii str. Malish 7]|uniref:Uncharacterized protein n=1 Tax=Rickettsia conorii (strain ATCC VR-613 / Malish 7) TaxID=272944 RepID=Q92IT0_RICCN|nr:unknown [Rickettsia conorii str. Malish 7]